MSIRVSDALLIGWLCLVTGSAGAAQTGDSIEIKPVRYTEWQDKLKNYRPDIVVVDYWATWCISCIERFPKMVEMQRHYHKQGVRFVSMCLDEHDDAPSIAKGQRFLQKINAQFEHYLMDENLMQAFEMLDLIGIPAVSIYDRSGKERYRLTGDNPNKQFTDEDVEAAIKTLLKPD